MCVASSARQRPVNVASNISGVDLKGCINNEMRRDATSAQSPLLLVDMVSTLEGCGRVSRVVPHALIRPGRTAEKRGSNGVLILDTWERATETNSVVDIRLRWERRPHMRHGHAATRALNTRTVQNRLPRRNCHRLANNAAAQGVGHYRDRPDAAIL